jgi:hypothetical protein
MIGVIRALKFSAVVVAATVMLLGASTQSHAQTTGTVQIKILKVGLIVGVGGGSGTLTYQGVQYPLAVGGVSIGTIGVAGVDLVGTAFNLHNPADIAGTYGAASASLAIVGGGKVARLQNEKGVILEVQGGQVGLEASLSLGGMTLALR